jgi:hypothetical protein
MRFLTSKPEIGERTTGGEVEGGDEDHEVVISTCNFRPAIRSPAEEEPANGRGKIISECEVGKNRRVESVKDEWK